MSKYSIKICRINDIHTARFLARCKVDFIGLHAIFGLPNPKVVREFQMIINELRTYYPKTRTVLVTRIINPNKLLKVYQKLHTDFVKWSAPVGRVEKEYFILRARQYEPLVDIFNVLSSTDTNISLAQKNIVGKYVILDKKFAGGTGTQIPKETIIEITKNLKNKYILLAGGMGRVDIGSWLSNIPVTGVDIMSSLEISESDKRKDILKVTNFLKKYLNNSKLPILKISTKKKLVSQNVSTIIESEKAIKNGVDIIEVDTKSLNGNLVEKIKSINPFVPIIVNQPDVRSL